MNLSKLSRRNFLIGTAGLASVAALRPVIAQSKKLRFGVGPLLPNPEDTKKAYMPVFAHLAKQIGADFDLVATTDWAGMAVAMGSGQLDVAWMGPWVTSSRTKRVPAMRSPRRSTTRNRYTMQS